MRWHRDSHHIDISVWDMIWDAAQAIIAIVLTGFGIMAAIRSGWWPLAIVFLLCACHFFYYTALFWTLIVRETRLNDCIVRFGKDRR